jgi:hypothetical protein
VEGRCDDARPGCGRRGGLRRPGVEEYRPEMCSLHYWPRSCRAQRLEACYVIAAIWPWHGRSCARSPGGLFRLALLVDTTSHPAQHDFFALSLATSQAPDSIASQYVAAPPRLCPCPSRGQLSLQAQAQLRTERLAFSSSAASVLTNPTSITTSSHRPLTSCLPQQHSDRFTHLKHSFRHSSPWPRFVESSLLSVTAPVERPVCSCTY